MNQERGRGVMNTVRVVVGGSASVQLTRPYRERVAPGIHYSVKLCDGRSVQFVTASFF